MLTVHDNATECVTACTPLPESVMVAGDPVALLVTITLPVEDPVAAGLKITLNVVLWEGLTVTGVPAPLKE